MDYVNRWNERTEIPAQQIVAWLGVGGSKFFDWKKRYGKINEHNGSIPRDFWLEDAEKKAILDFHSRNPLEVYRRLTFMMLDADVVAVSPSSVYRVLREAGVMDRFHGQLERIFRAVPNRLMFAGHYHKWRLVAPDRIEDWNGSDPFDLSTGKYFVVVGALCEGRYAIFDTRTSELFPLYEESV